jgi:hypothetical protein
MGANAQTSVPAFTTGQVLTAQQQTEINTGVPVFATTTTRDAAFGGTGEKTLAQGQLCYLESTNVVQYYNGSAWATLAPTSSALTYITGATFTTVASVSTAASTFTSTYANYLVMLDVTSVSTTLDVLLRLRTGSTDTAGTAYWWTITGSTPGNATATSSIQVLDNVQTVTVSYGGSAQFNVFNPQLARNTNIVGAVWSEAPAYNGVLGAGLYNTTSYDAFTLLTSTGTMSGNYRVYGYANS